MSHPSIVLALFLVCVLCCSAQLNLRFDRQVLGNLQGRTPEAGQGVVPTTLSQNYALVAEIFLGTPGQSMNCLLDTGSSDLWVPSIRCQSCRKENLFEADASGTFQPQWVQDASGRRVPRREGITYGSGQIVGYAVDDTLQIGSVTVPDMDFIIVEDAELPRSRSWDGICGLGWAGISKTDRPLYVRLQEQGIKAIFTFHPGPVGAQPFMHIGEDPHTDLMEPSTLTWAQAEEMGSHSGPGGGEKGFWIVSGGLAITKQNPVPAKFLVDTGTNQVLLAPTSVYNSFMDSLLPANTFQQLCGSDPRQGNLVVCDCSIDQGADMPPLRVYLGNRPFALNIRDLFRRVPSNDGSELCLLQIQPNGMMGGPSAMPVGQVLGGLLGGLFGGGSSPNSPGMSSGGGELAGLLGSLLGSSVSGGRRLQNGHNPTEEIWMIGGVFLEHFVTVFDFDNGRIGFAEPRGGVHSINPTRLYEMPPITGTWEEHLRDSGGHGFPRIAILSGSSFLVAVALVTRSIWMRSQRRIEQEVLCDDDE